MLRRADCTRTGMEARDVQSVEIQRLLLPREDEIPNHPHWPLLLYLDAAPHDAGEVEQLFSSNGWGGTWRDGVFDYHHYHTTSHEVLAVVSGWSKVQFGGPQGQAVELSAGDVAILPAGTGHKRLEASGEFLVVGAYPKGQEDYDLQRDPPGEAALKRIEQTARPAADPVFGEKGPLVENWPA